MHTLSPNVRHCCNVFKYLTHKRSYLRSHKSDTHTYAQTHAHTHTHTHVYIQMNQLICTSINTKIHIYIYTYTIIHTILANITRVGSYPHPYTMGWLRLVGSLKLQLFFAKEPYKRDDILQKRRVILRSLRIATPYGVAMISRLLENVGLFCRI